MGGCGASIVTVKEGKEEKEYNELRCVWWWSEVKSSPRSQEQRINSTHLNSDFASTLLACLVTLNSRPVSHSHPHSHRHKPGDMPLALPQLLTLLVVCFASYASGFLLTSPSAATTSSMTAATTLLSHADSAASASASATTPTTSAYIDVIMCRHGETCHNAEGRCQGMEDVSRLTAQGEAQALELGRALAEQGQRFDRIFISPLARARHTFDQMERQWVTLGFKAYPRPTFVPEIQEICLYEWQGHLRKDLEARYPVEFENWMNQPAAFRVGEHFPVRELWTRAKRGWEQILSQSLPGERVLVVAHSGINQALCFAALGHEEPMYRRLNFPNCGALHLRLALPATPAQAAELVQAGGYTLPVPEADGAENDKVSSARHYRRVHPSDWEPEVHLPRAVGAVISTKEAVVGAAKR